MGKYAPDFDPQNADFEGIAQEVFALDPCQEKVRGQSNQHGDDGLFRNVKTGDMTTVESKFNRENKNVQKQVIMDLHDTIIHNKELYEGKGRGILYTTSASISKGAKSYLANVNRNEDIIQVVCYDALQNLAVSQETP